MTKQPLHNIDSLFQQKLEELPVDMSQQQAQWQSLRNTMHRPATGLLSQLRQSWLKWFCLTVIAMVPFGVFYVATQEAQPEVAALGHTGGNVTRTLLLLNTRMKDGRPFEPIADQTPVATTTQKPNTVKPTEVKPAVKTNEVIVIAPPAKRKDSTQAVPAKKELPVIKKTDSTYIYWQ